MLVLIERMREHRRHYTVLIGCVEWLLHIIPTTRLAVILLLYQFEMSKCRVADNTGIGLQQGLQVTPLGVKITLTTANVEKYQNTTYAPCDSHSCSYALFFYEYKYPSLLN